MGLEGEGELAEGSGDFFAGQVFPWIAVVEVWRHGGWCGGLGGDDWVGWVSWASREFVWVGWGLPWVVGGVE